MQRNEFLKNIALPSAKQGIGRAKVTLLAALTAVSTLVGCSKNNGYDSAVGDKNEKAIEKIISNDKDGIDELEKQIKDIEKRIDEKKGIIEELQQALDEIEDGTYSDKLGNVYDSNVAGIDAAYYDELSKVLKDEDESDRKKGEKEAEDKREDDINQEVKTKKKIDESITEQKKAIKDLISYMNTSIELDEELLKSLEASLKSWEALKIAGAKDATEVLIDVGEK